MLDIGNSVMALMLESGGDLRMRLPPYFCAPDSFTLLRRKSRAPNRSANSATHVRTRHPRRPDWNLVFGYELLPVPFRTVTELESQCGRTGICQIEE